MERVAVGIDGSRGARDALLWTTRLAGSLGTKMCVVNCFTNPYAEVSHDDHQRLLTERKQTLDERWAAPAREAGVSLTTVVANGDPRHALLSTIEAEGAEMLVLGRTGSEGGLGFAHVGSVVEHVVHHANIPVAVIPSGWSGPVERIVIGLDGSAESLQALSLVGEIAPALDAEVIAVQIEEPYPGWTHRSRSKNWHNDVEHQIETWTAPLRDAGVSVLAVPQRDLHPAAGLLGVTSARHGDLLIVGTRGFGGIAGLYTGHVARKVLHHATMPLLLVPSK